MAHYDLYASLGLSRDDSCDELAAEITRRLQAGRATNPGGADELRVARAVLGSPGRRAQYDTVLDDPGAAPLTPADITALAGMPERPVAQGYQDGTQGQAVQTAQPGAQAPPDAREKGKGASKTGIILAAVVAVVVLAAAVLGFFLLRGGSDEPEEGSEETSTGSSDGGSAGSSDGEEDTSAGSSDPHEMLDEFMSLDKRDERADWIEDHTDMNLVRKFSEDFVDKPHEMPTLKQYAAMQADDYTAEVERGGAPMAKETGLLSDQNLSSEDIAEAKRVFGAEVSDIYFADLGDRGAIVLAKSDGSWHFLAYAR